MTLMQLAEEVRALRTAGETIEVLRRHFADHAICLDVGHPMSVLYGIDAIHADCIRRREMQVTYRCTSRGPWVHGDRFVIELTTEIASLPDLERRTVRETAIYTVRDDRIVQLQCFSVETVHAADAEPAPTVAVASRLNPAQNQTAAA